MPSELSKLTIKGFKSIESLEAFELSSLNVLIGANGSGKSNFVDFFRLLRNMADETLQRFCNERGADGMFFLGPHHTRSITARLEFGQNIYEFELTPTTSGLQISDERIQYLGGQHRGTMMSIGQGNGESRLKDVIANPGKLPSNKGVPPYIHESISSWTVYHFHETGMTAAVRRKHSSRDRENLDQHASNLAAYLLYLREHSPASYELIRSTICNIAPFFDDFKLEPEKDMVRLEWLQKGSRFPFQPSQLSDGTLRFMCLATTLLQPDLPKTVIIDEPELGLHPFAIAMLAEIVKTAAQNAQVIITTQSPTLLDHFEPEDIIVMNRSGGSSKFERLNGANLKDWLKDYSIGELWQKNVVAGGPSFE